MPVIPRSDAVATRDLPQPDPCPSDRAACAPHTPQPGEMPGFEGVWANASTLESCREELEEVLEEWLLFRVSRQLPLPVVEGLELRIREVA